MRIAAGDDTNDLWICRIFVGDILDALALSNGLRYAERCGIDTVGRDLFLDAQCVDVFEIGVFHRFHSAIDTQIAELIATIVDVNFAKSAFLRGSCAGETSTHTQDRGYYKEKRNKSFFHECNTSIKIGGMPFGIPPRICV